MATKVTKDETGVPVAKPRRGASPSDNGTGTRRGLLSSEKPIPNYLRPTKSSSSETPKALKKKPLSSPDNRKPVLDRRSSFDRPPVASPLQKIISSGPGKRMSMGPLRTAKVVSRTHLASNVRGKVIAKKSSPMAAASSSLATKNKEKSRDAPAVVDDMSVCDNSGVSSVASSEKLPLPRNVETEEVPGPGKAEDILMEHEDSEVVHRQLDGVAHLEDDVVDKEEVFEDDGAVLASKEEDDSAVAAQPHMEEVRKEIEDKEELVSDDSKGEEKEAEDLKGITEATEAAAEVEAEDKKENKPMVEEVVVAVKEEKEAGDAAKKAEDSDALMSDSEKPSEEKEGEVANVEEKQAVVVEAEKTLVKQRSEKPAVVAAPAKKDLTQANNDIIEETTKKLMESSRKNKVKALAGAFETVISLERPGQV